MTEMVKGEHLRPLIGFGVVCVTAALIMGTGLGTPSVTGIVASPHVRAVPDAPALVLGQTFAEPSPQHPTPARPAGSSAIPAAVQRETAVLASLSVTTEAAAAPSAPTTATTVRPAASGESPKSRRPHRNAHQVRHVSVVAKPQATIPSPAPAPSPTPQPHSSPAPGHGHGHGEAAGPAIGYGVGHGGRNDAAGGRGGGPVTEVVDHRGRHPQRGPGAWNHGGDSRHSHGHSGDDSQGGSAPGSSADGHDHHSGHGGYWRSQHR